MRRLRKYHDVLLDRVGLAILDFLRCHHHLHGRGAAHGDIRQDQVTVVREYRGLALGEAVGVSEQHLHAALRIVDEHVLIGYARVSQRGAKILLMMIELLLDRAFDVDLIDEVDAATQVEPEFERVQAEISHPLRNARGLRQGDRELIRPRLRDHISRLELILRARESQREASLVEECAGRHDTLFLEDLLDHRSVGLDHGRAIPRELQRALLAE